MLKSFGIKLFIKISLHENIIALANTLRAARSKYFADIIQIIQLSTLKYKQNGSISLPDIVNPPDTTMLKVCYYFVCNKTVCPYQHI